jgi:hypothetical protein
LADSSLESYSIHFKHNLKQFNKDITVCEVCHVKYQDLTELRTKSQSDPSLAYDTLLEIPEKLSEVVGKNKDVCVKLSPGESLQRSQSDILSLDDIFYVSCSVSFTQSDFDRNIGGSELTGIVSVRSIFKIFGKTQVIYVNLQDVAKDQHLILSPKAPVPRYPYEGETELTEQEQYELLHALNPKRDL